MFGETSEPKDSVDPEVQQQLPGGGGGGAGEPAPGRLMSPSRYLEPMRGLMQGETGWLLGAGRAISRQVGGTQQGRGEGRPR